MLKRKLIILITIVTLGLLAYNTVKAYPIGDPDDIFYVTAPAANQKVSGTINITWRMWDDDQSKIQYTAKLYDAASCQNVNYGTINSNLSGSSNKNTDNILSWNTNNTQSSTNLPDGNYCVQVCAAMKNGTTPYSACNSRIVKIVNHNHLPVITSNPSNLTVKESDSWSYQVTGYDQDGDPLTYNLNYSTNFIQINSQTGLIQTNGNSKALSGGVNSATYKIVVSVNDGISGSATQEFNLTVVRDTPIAPPPAPNPTPTPNPTPVPPPTTNPPPPDTETSHPTKIDILYPTDNSILKGTQNEIKWDITDQDGIKKILLEYSKSNNKDWQLIKSLESESEVASNTYVWDVSKIPDDVYYLRITVTDNQNAEVNRVSDNFLTKNNTDETQSEPLVINLQPESNSEIKSNTPKISAEFVPSSGSRVETNSIKIILNDVDITSKCTTSETGFSCTITEPLEEGKHSVNVNFKDSNGKTAALNWTFTVNTKPETQTLTQDTIVILGREIPRNSLIILFLLCVIFIVLLIIPWFLYRNWKKRRGNNQPPTNSGFGETYGREIVPITVPPPAGSFQEINNIQSNIPANQPQPVIVQAPQMPTQDSSQAEIERNLMEYWKGQGQGVPEMPAAQPVQPESQQPYPIQPFQEIQPDYQPTVAPPVQPQEVLPEQPIAQYTPPAQEINRPEANNSQSVQPQAEPVVSPTELTTAPQQPSAPTLEVPQPQGPTLTYQEPEPIDPPDTNYQEPTPTDVNK